MRKSLFGKQIDDSDSPLLSQLLPKKDPQYHRAQPVTHVDYQSPPSGQVIFSSPAEMIDKVNLPCTASQLGQDFTDNWKPEDVRLGEVLLAPWYAPDFSHRVSLAHQDTARTYLVSSIYSELRLLVVASRLPDGLKCFPLSIYGSEGLERVPEHTNEYMYRVRSDRDHDSFWAKIPDSTFVTVCPYIHEIKLYRGWEPRPHTFINISRTCCVESKTPIRRMGASLESNSLRRCVDTYYRIVKTGLEDLVQYEAWETQRRVPNADEVCVNLPWWQKAGVRK